MTGLRVLLTNHTLAARAGSELYVRDLALALLERGHSPVAYSPHIGEVGLELRRATIPVVDDLRNLAAPPDIIHGQHHTETMTALLHFPGVPAVFFCHGWAPPEEAPPLFPRILRYVAVDDTCRDRIVCEHGIAEERVRVILNFVDLERFPARGPLPPRPRRALLFSNRASDETHLPTVREACAEARLELDVMGDSAGQSCAAPERFLGQYDLVFAKGRCALEALAVGTAVVLCDAAGAGPLVTAGEFERLRRLNFGVRALREEVSTDFLLTEIQRYDAADAAKVSGKVRALAGRGMAVDEIVALYKEVVTEHAGAGTPEPGPEGRAAGAYLRQLVEGIRLERVEMLARWQAFQDSPTGRLRNLLQRTPLIGPLAHSLLKRFR